MPGLNESNSLTHILIISDDKERFRSALMLALAQQALGQEVRIFLQMDAVGLLTPHRIVPKDMLHQQVGLPSLTALLDEVLKSGVVICACQSGLDIVQISAEDIDPRITISGLVSFMATIGPNDRLLTI